MHYFTCILLIILALCGTRIQGASIRTNNSSISISFFATDLSGCDLISKCDASVTIMCASVYSDWKNCGRTRTIRNNNNPKWPEVFTFEHLYGTSQRWRLDLKDHNLLGSKLIASFPIIVDEYAQQTGDLLENQIPDNTGTLWVKRLES